MKKRAVSLMLIIFMITSYGLVNARPILDGSVEFLTKTKDLVNTTRDMSLILIALTSAQGKVDYDLTENITYIANLLLSWQNPDGGWGYFKGSVSNVVDTSYAVIALNRALHLYEKGTPEYSRISHALDNGISFLLDSYSTDGWGYVSKTEPEFYPTVMAIWALGERGFTVQDEIIRDSIKYLETTEEYNSGDPTSIALYLLAFKSVGHKVDPSLVNKIKTLLNSGNLSTTERALLTYVLVNFENPDFEVIKTLLMLENLKHGDSIFYWANYGNLFIPPSIIETTSYATLSFSAVSDKLAEGYENPAHSLCNLLKDLQESDGSWEDSPRITYYALKTLKACYFNDESIQKGLQWVQKEYKRERYEATLLRTFTQGYAYSLLTLAEFGLLNETEKLENINFIKKIKLRTGKWGNFLGPQPYDTALAVKTLLALGVPAKDEDIVNAKNWLLSITKTGWGTYLYNPIYPHMITPEVSVTLEVLEALAPLSTKKELEPHLRWLIRQRTPHGTWANIKEYYWFNVLRYEGTPTVELTTRAALLLRNFGYDYMDNVRLWILEKYKNGELTTPIDASFAAWFFLNVRFIPKTNLYTLVREMQVSDFTIIYVGDRKGLGEDIRDIILEMFNRTFAVEEYKQFEESGNYLVLAGFSDFDINQYNPYVRVSVVNDTIIIGSKTYTRSDTVVVIPGRLEKGYLLFFLYDNKKLEMAINYIFESGLIKYFNGNMAIVNWKDRNNNEIVELEELTVKFLR